jgi:hypothetical protein
VGVARLALVLVGTQTTNKLRQSEDTDLVYHLQIFFNGRMILSFTSEIIKTQSITQTVGSVLVI